MLYTSKQPANKTWWGFGEERRTWFNFRLRANEKYRIIWNSHWGSNYTLNTNKTLMLPQQKPTGSPLSGALKFPFSSELNENVCRKTATHNLPREESLQKLHSKQASKQLCSIQRKLCLHVLNCSCILGKSFNTGYPRWSQFLKFALPSYAGMEVQLPANNAVFWVTESYQFYQNGIEGHPPHSSLLTLTCSNLITFVIHTCCFFLSQS